MSIIDKTAARQSFLYNGSANAGRANIFILRRPIGHYFITRAEEHFKNTYEPLNLKALKMSMLYKNHIFQCMGKNLCGISKGTFEMPHKILYPYIERCKTLDFIHSWKFKSF